MWVIVFSGVMTFILLKLVGIFIPLRLSDEELEIGDHAIHGNEVYPSDVPTLGGPHAAGVAASAGSRGGVGSSALPSARARPPHGRARLGVGTAGGPASAGPLLVCGRGARLLRRLRRCACSARRGQSALFSRCSRAARGAAQVAMPTGQATPVPPSPQ